MKNQRGNVKLVDESNRTLNQNSYAHVLIRIVAAYTGETEYYAKQVYFKKMANPGIFKRITKDSVTGKITETYLSSKELSIPEMRKAIDGFKRWVLETFDGKLVLPEADISDDGTVTFKSDAEKEGFVKAEIEASKVDTYI
jgi:hypothetical protein